MVFPTKRYSVEAVSELAAWLDRMVATQSGGTWKVARQPLCLHATYYLVMEMVLGNWILSCHLGFTVVYMIFPSKLF